MIGESTGIAGSWSGAGPRVLPRDNNAMGRDEFLQLLVAQLSNQDPLSPMQAEEFATQLAQFAQVEQLIDLKEVGLAGLQGIQALALAQGNASAVTVLGKEILAPGDGLVLSEGAPGRVTVGVGGQGGRGTLVILDEQGFELNREEVGFLRPGRHDLEPSSSIEGLEPGSYRYRLEVVDDQGQRVSTQLFTRVVVDGLRYGPEGPVLMAGGWEIPLSSVVEIADSTG